MVSKKTKGASDQVRNPTTGLFRHQIFGHCVGSTEEVFGDGYAAIGIGNSENSVRTVWVGPAPPVSFRRMHFAGGGAVLGGDIANASDHVALFGGSGIPGVGLSLADQAESEIGEAAEGDPLPPVHPGEILLEQFIRPHDLSPISTARRLGVPRTRIERIVTGQTPITEDTALRLERLFGASAEFWLTLQMRYSLAVARKNAGGEISAIEPARDLSHD